MSSVGMPTGNANPVVLVVEDDPIVRITAVAHLQEHGFSVLEAPTADEAQVLIKEAPDVSVVFSDVQMPGTLDGIALAQWLARECPTVRVLLTSGRAVLPERSGAWRFLAKPYRLDELERQLRSLLAGPES